MLPTGRHPERGIVGSFVGCLQSEFEEIMFTECSFSSFTFVQCRPSNCGARLKVMRTARAFTSADPPDASTAHKAPQ